MNPIQMHNNTEAFTLTFSEDYFMDPFERLKEIEGTGKKIVQYPIKNYKLIREKDKGQFKYTNSNIYEITVKIGFYSSYYRYIENGWPVIIPESHQKKPFIIFGYNSNMTDCIFKRHVDFSDYTATFKIAVPSKIKLPKNFTIVPLNQFDHGVENETIFTRVKELCCR